jgi:hypothetical protein
MGYTDLYNNQVQKPTSTFAKQAKGCTVTWMHWLMATGNSHNQIEKMRVCAHSKLMTYKSLERQVVHNISNSITKLTSAGVSAQEP